MKLLVVTERFRPEVFKINDLAQGLRDRGHQVHIVTAMPNYPVGRYFTGFTLTGPYSVVDDDGIRVDRVPVIPRGSGGAVRLALNYSSYAILGSLRVLVARRDWDAVLAYQPSPVTTLLPAVMARSSHVPLLAWVQDLWPETLESTGMLPWGPAVRLVGGLSRWLYSSCDTLLVQSEAYIPAMRGIGIPDDRVVCLPNWAEPTYERAGDGPGPSLEGPLRVTFAGNLGRVQALDTVLDAIASLRERVDCRWVFIGDGARRTWLEQQVAKRGLERHVELVGRRPMEEMPTWFSRSSAMLVSLAADPILGMTVPTKLQSYMAAGMPVIGSLNGEGARIIRESKAGLVAPAEDPVALARAVEQFGALPRRERKAMGERAVAYYRARFSRSLCLDTVEAQLVDAVERKRRGAAR